MSDEQYEVRPFNPTPEEIEKCNELRKTVWPVDSATADQGLADAPAIDSTSYSDHDLHRFLIARKYDVDAAADMLRDEIAWRAEWPYSPPDEFSQGHKEADWVVTQWAPECDRYGRPVLFVRPAQVNPKTMDVDFLVEAVLRVIEEAIRNRMAEGVHQFIIMFSYAGWGLRNADTSLSQRVIQLVQNYYPERLGRVFILEAPWLFWGVWKLIQVFLDERVKSKVVFLSGKQCRSELEKILPPSSIPENHGGDWAFVQGINSFE